MVTLPYNPTAGLRPPGTLAPASREQWAHDFAIEQANKLANGTIDGSEGGLFSAATFSSLGLNPFNPSDIGSGMVSGGAYNILYQLGSQLASGGYSSLTPQQRVGLSDPTGLRAGEHSLSDTDKSNATSMAMNDADNARAMAIANLQESGMNARNAADLASRMSIAQLQEAGASTRNAQRIAADLSIAGMESQDRRYSTDVNAAVSREDIAARERIASGDRSSREGIANADRAESGRQFDLGLSEDRRQFNSTMLFQLLDRGVELARKPVDWIAYQYYLGNIGAPINALTLSSAAAMMGAVPPTGPSAAGPVIGGPAVLDGDQGVAQQLGITNAGPVSMREALAMNPGGESGWGDGSTAAINTLQQFGGADAVDSKLAEARTTQLPQDISPDFTNRAQMVSAEVVRSAQMATLATGPQGALPALPGTGAAADTSLAAPAAGGMPSLDGMQQSLAPQPDVIQPAPMGANPAQPAAAPFTNLSAAGTTTGSAGGIYTGNEAGGATGSPMPQPAAVGTTPAGAMGTPAAAAMAGAGGGAGGATPLPQGNTANIEAMLASLAGELGIPIEQLRALFPAHLMTPQYSSDVIANSPIIQALRNGTPLSAFNTGPKTGSPFTNIRATGTETGVRGGQDINATAYLGALPSQREMMQGAMEGTGQYFPDTVEQLMRSSPLTNVESGSFGRRRYG